LNIGRLTDGELSDFRDFCRQYWGAEHPLIHNEKMFDYYYRDGDKINFVRALDDDGGFLGVCGFLTTSKSAKPDVFVSFLLSKKGAPFGLSYMLFDCVSELTDCRTIACNNIRRKTAPLYEFHGWTVGDMNQWYRLNKRGSYTLCKGVSIEAAENGVAGSVKWKKIGEAELREFDFKRYSDCRPYKDFDYFKKRFIEYPWHGYELYQLDDEGSAVVAVRRFDADGACALRVVDFFGERRLMGECRELFDFLLSEHNADFIDLFELGADAEAMKRSGMMLLNPKGEAVVPLYLLPPLYENVVLTSFVDVSQGYLMMRADGDQDRPNMPTAN